MSKHTEALHGLGEFTLNQWLAVGIALGGRDAVRQLLNCVKVTVVFDEDKKMVVVEAKLPSRTLLRSSGTINLPPRNEGFDPQTFFKTGKGLYVWDGFAKRILPVAKPIQSLAPVTLASWDLAHDATDAQIRAELSSEHVFEDADVLCGHLAGMIERQSKGAEGPLLNNGYANIFYVRGVSSEVFAVYVYWYADVRYWNVFADTLDASRWNAGYRVFSRSTAAA